jgi:hypothetical protein
MKRRRLATEVATCESWVAEARELLDQLLKVKKSKRIDRSSDTLAFRGVSLLDRRRYTVALKPCKCGSTKAEMSVGVEGIVIQRYNAFMRCSACSAPLRLHLKENQK